MRMEIKTYKIAALTFDPHNARKHPTKNIEALKASLKQFGQRKPIVLTKDNVVIAGNGTLQAAQELGWDSIDGVTVPADWDDKTISAFALADNRTAELAQWDARELLDQLEELDEFDMNALGFDAWQLPEPADIDRETPESRGLGNPIISYEIVFDDHAQQNVWFEFIKFARVAHPDAETNAERIVLALQDFMGDS